MRQEIRPWLNFEPMEHQWEAAEQAIDHNEYAFYMEMGTGKTLSAIILALMLFKLGKIDRVQIVAPTPIKQVWEHELDKFIADDGPDVSWFVNTAGNSGLDRWIQQRQHFEDTLHFLVVGIESFSQGHAAKKVQAFCNDRTLMVVDESSYIKKHGRPNGRKFYGSRRTWQCYQLGGLCGYRLIMTGTEISQGIHDLFSQFFFLNWNIIGSKSWTAFKNRYCEIGYFDQIEGYQHVDELMSLVRPYVYQKRKSEVLDLPDKIYERIYVDPSKPQLEAIKTLETTMEAEMEGRSLTTATHLERYTRYHQIIGGNFPYEERDGKGNKHYYTTPIEGKNPKIEAMIEVIDNMIPRNAHIIIWARFMPEIEQIVDRLGEDVVYQFHGQVDEDERAKWSQEFQSGRGKKIMVANPAVGGMGQTWTIATYVIYYSCGFSWEQRIQSEDRAHRKGQTNKVTYIDIELNHKYDRNIHAALKRKMGMAEYIKLALADGMRER